MLLIVTNSEDVTAGYLCSRMDREGCSYFRLDSDRIVGELSVSYRDFAPTIQVGERRISAEEIDNVWLRRPKAIEIKNFEGDVYEEQHVRGEWSEAIEGFLSHIPERKWINHPTANVSSSHKLEQLSRAKKYGLTVPSTIVTQDSEDLRRFWDESSGQVVVKPMCSGFVERNHPSRDTHIYTNRLPESHLLLDAVSKTPALYQKQVEKVEDVRVTSLDSNMVAVSLTANESGEQRLDIRRNNMADVTYRVVDIPADVADTLASLLKSYGLRFAAVDFVVDKSGVWFFLEINPNGQWAWLDLVGGVDIAANFIRLCENNSATI